MIDIKLRLKLKKESLELIFIWTLAGLMFPIVAIGTDLHALGLGLNWLNLVKIHHENGLHYVIDLVPILLGVFTYFRACHQEDTADIISALTTVSQKLEAEKLKHMATGQQLSNILDKSPISYVVIEPCGTIKYANPATKQVYGSSETVGLNILEFDTVIGTAMEAMIQKSILGEQGELTGYHHVSATTGQEKYVDVTFLPFEKVGVREVYEVLMISVDMTHEKQLIEKIEESYFNIIVGLARALDARDPYTSKHSVKVREYTELILNHLEMSNQERSETLIAAELHDIGKLGIRDHILNKKGHLTEEEYGIMKNHPVIGADLFKELEGYQNISNIIRHHHERTDGKGYPHGLREDQIPLGSQIIAIADAFDAMMTDRVYRQALTYEKAVAELEKGKGTQFGAALVDLFIKHYHHV